MISDGAEISGCGVIAVFVLGGGYFQDGFEGVSRFPNEHSQQVGLGLIYCSESGWRVLW